ncbi:MAG TPA: FtsX-like permease family protein [Jiangellaceae bacterium]
MLYTTWQRILRNKGRLILTVLAVAIGVTFLTGSLVLSDSTRTALKDSYRQVYAGADVMVRGPDTFGDGPFTDGSTPLPEQVLMQVRTVPGVVDAEGRNRSVAQILPPGGVGDGTGAVAMAVPADPAKASIDVRTGRLPQTVGEFAVDATVADEQGFEVGDPLEVLLPSGPISGEVVGTVGFGRLGGLAGGARVLVDAETADELFGKDGYAEIAVRAAVEPQVLADRLVDALGADATVLTATEAANLDAAAANRQVSVFGWIILAVAAVALVVGGFLVANTFRMLVAQRTRELGMLRAIGASRRQVAASVRIEAAIAGSVGSVLGVLLGVGAGVFLVGAAGRLLPGVPPTSVTLTPWAVLAGPVVGIGMALLASRGAARRSLRVSPMAAMRSASATAAPLSRLRLITGPLSLAAGTVGVVIGVNAASSMLLAVGAVGLIFGFGLVFPLIIRPVLAMISRPLSWVGVTGGIARQQALAAPRRTGATAAALAVGLALVSFLLTFSATLGAASPGLIVARQHAEYTIRSTAPEGLHDFLVEATDRIDQLPEVVVASAVAYGGLRVTDPTSDESRPRAVTAFVVDPAAVAALFDVRATSGDVAVIGGTGVAVRENVAVANGWPVGHRLTLQLPDGATTDVQVTALFDGEVTTDWIIAPQLAEGHLAAAYREGFVKLAPGTDVDEVRPTLEAELAPYPAATLLSREEQADEVADANDSTLGILTALFSLSLVVAILGVVNTLTLAVAERTRELALVRAIGASRGQVRAMVRWEAVLTGGLGAVTGVTLGVALAWIAAKALPHAAQTFTVPGWHVAAATIATGGLAVIASLAPSIRAARVDFLAAVGSD